MDLKDLEKLRQEIVAARDGKRPCITVCGGTGCHAYGCLKVAQAFRDEVRRQGLQDKVDVRQTGCHGFCERGPIVVLQPRGVFYQKIRLADVPEVVSKTVGGGEVIDRLLYADPATGEKIAREEDVPFYKKQHRLLLGSNGFIDPTSIDDYIALGGYRALAKALSGMSPDDVIAEATASGLRGRGGAGFPTGKKWAICRRSPGETKYVICNADEGDPGAYMDRSLLEGNPHSVIEGMIIGAYAIGARQGFVYVRNEYPLAVENVTAAVKDCRQRGLLGKSILGSGFDFDLSIFRGAGAFVSGEETSLMASIEGRRASPRQKPPFPALAGLWGKPTNINNVETWANVTWILRNGAKAYAAIGTQDSKGTKIFALVGKINNTGLVEVPMGMKLREIIFDIGGGIKGGKPFKAVQTGGPSGGCIPAGMLDLPIDYASLAQAGSMMGSGGMIVMDEDTCMVDVARYFLHFTQEESCGKCVPCRVGTRQMAGILARITRGQGEEGDLEKLETLAKTVKAGSLCGLGQTAPNPVLTTIRHFRHEYDAHIREKRCPALACKELLTFGIDQKKCIGCLLCLKACPVKAVSGTLKKPHDIDQAVCIKCGACFEVCPAKVRAVTKTSGAPAPEKVPQ
ncbi:MAG: NADH-quinone oxidoreductase subunit NuoF [Elusimicrobia bacterium]|nr:NADH-quinone oxidoreductase subunit NuoF [Elusimicrobiota bacterium]